MTNSAEGQSWLLVTIRLPASPSRHRVAVWRELRRIGAISLGGGTWAAPAATAFADGFERAAALVAKAGGQMLMFDARTHSAGDETALRTEFNTARTAEWTEFTSECAKFADEIAKERRVGKLTVAELDEEEHSLDRLRRWSRELRARDIFGVPDGVRAEEQLKRCGEILDGYANDVYSAVHAPLGLELGDV